MLTQVAGRAGREKEKGKVIIQTYNPDNFAIECSKKQNYDLFYQTEIGLRQSLKYPPFCDIILIGMTSTNEKELVDVATKLYYYLKNRLVKENIGMILYPPVSAPVDKIKNKIRWRMIIKCKMNDTIIALINDMLEEYGKMKVRDTRVTIDVNPNDMAH